MKASYQDIRAAAHPEEPQWWDDNGVPRYIAFHPDHCPDIYTSEVVLLEIECQECREKMLVEIHNDNPCDRLSLSKSVETHIRHSGQRNNPFPFHYGDPPYHVGNGCAAGRTMNSLPVRIVQFWRRVNYVWERVSQYEIECKNFS